MYLELQLKYIKQFNVCRISKALLPYKKMQHELLAPVKILQRTIFSVKPLQMWLHRRHISLHKR
jgi:hypothetical protein